MSTRPSLGFADRLRENLSLAISLLRPETRAEAGQLRAGGKRSRDRGGHGSRIDVAADEPLPQCRPLNAAEMNEVERLSSMRAALYPKD